MAVYSLDGSQDNCYPNTTVLVNKFGIKNQEELDRVEKQITLLRAVQAEQETKFENVDFEFYKNTHRRIFADVYEWAGTVRTINISKKGTVFCNACEIERIGRLKFERLKKQNYLRKMDSGNFLDELTDLYHELNMLHPFREGNGRTLRLFVTLLVRNTGGDIDFNNTDSDLLTIATIKASQGDKSMLRNVFERLVLI
ncbi:MAG: Fic family protein [Ruminococcus sp.]|nr:Fic family protein [Ruminococcus sp.]